jgi:hypothetical protein
MDAVIDAIPPLAPLVMTAVTKYSEAPAWRDGHGIEGFRETIKLAELSAAAGVPDADGVVLFLQAGFFDGAANRDNESAVVGEGNAANTGSVPCPYFRDGGIVLLPRGHFESQPVHFGESLGHNFDRHCLGRLRTIRGYRNWPVFVEQSGRFAASDSWAGCAGRDFLVFRLLRGLDAEVNDQTHGNAEGKQQSSRDATAHKQKARGRPNR